MNGSQHHPPIRRVVTGHKEDGKSIVLSDEQLPSRLAGDTSSRCTEIFRTEEFPSDNGVVFHDLVKEKEHSLISENGSALWSFEMPPGTRSVRFQLLWKELKNHPVFVSH